MTTIRPWRTAALLAAGWLVGWGAVTAHASDIIDNGKFFSSEVVTKAKADLNQLEKRSHLGTRIETYDSLPADKQEAFDKLTTKEEQNKFYANWLLERAKATDAKGLFILITRKPSHLQVETDKTIQGRGFKSEQRNEIRDILVKNFKEKKYDDGLQATVARLETISLRLAETARHVAPASRQNTAAHRPVGGPVAQVPQRGQGMGIWGWIILAVVVWLVFSLIAGLIRSMSGGYRGGPMQPGYGGQPGYGQPGYGGGYGGGGGGFFSNMMGGLAGAMAGNWLYNSMSGSHHGQASAGDWTGGSTDAGAGGGADFGGGGGDFGGGDFGGGGGDFGGGGGDFGGGDFGGGGGDFGGGGGGGDFGGGGGDF